VGGIGIGAPRRQFGDLHSAYVSGVWAKVRWLFSQPPIDIKR
jgi:hypothetical protein